MMNLCPQIVRSHGVAETHPVSTQHVANSAHWHTMCFPLAERCTAAALVERLPRRRQSAGSWDDAGGEPGRRSDDRLALEPRDQVFDENDQRRHSAQRARRLTGCARRLRHLR